MIVSLLEGAGHETSQLGGINEMSIMNYPEGNKKNSSKYKKQIKGWSRDGSVKKYTNKICRNKLSHPLYIPA